MNSFIKPFAAAWRARAYFALAALFWVAFHVLTPLVNSNLPVQTEWWADLISKATGSFDKFSYFIAIAGLIYAVLSDLIEYIWLNNLKTEFKSGFSEVGNIFESTVSSFVSGLSNLSYESIRMWVDNGRGTKEQIKIIAETSLINIYGKHNTGEGNLLEFILGGVLDIWGTESAQVWENFVSQVTLRPISIPDYFEWEETRTYSLICKSKSGVVPIRLEGSVRIRPDEIRSAIEHLEFRFRFGSENKFDFQTWWSANSISIDGSQFKLEKDGVVLEYDGIWLAYFVNIDCNISVERSEVRIFEKSYVSVDDRCYALTLRHPTHGIRASLSIEGASGWAVKPPVVSAVNYPKAERTVQVHKDHKHSCQWSTQGWALPGVAMVIEWSPG